MAKVRKKPLNGTPGGIFPVHATYRKDKVTLNAINETDLNKNNKETTENDPEQVSLKGDCEEIFKNEVLVTKTQNPVHVCTQAILVLAVKTSLWTVTFPEKFFHFMPITVSHKTTLNTSDDLPQKEADLLVYLVNPVLKNIPKTNTQQRLSFFVRTCSNMSLTETKQTISRLIF
jgi:hypothetical protein